MRKLLFTFSFVALFFLQIGLSAEAIKLRAATGANQDSSSYQGLLKLKELLESSDVGDFSVELYHSGQLGDDRQLTEGVQLGTLDMAVVSVGNAVPFLPEIAIWEFPFLFPNEQVAHKVLDGDVGRDLLDRLAERNIIGLAYWENGFRNITNSRRPINEIADLKGLKLRTLQNQVHVDAFKALGANPTPMSFSELYTGLQQKIVDGQENPFTLIYQNKFFEAQEYLSASRHVYSPYLVLVSKRFYDNLTEEQLDFVKISIDEARDYQRQVNKEQDNDALEQLKDKGMKFNEVSLETLQEMREVVQPVIDKYTKNIGEDLVNSVYNAIEEAENN